MYIVSTDRPFAIVWLADSHSNYTIVTTIAVIFLFDLFF